jgi:hypothetical protein
VAFATAMVNMQDHGPMGLRWLEALHLCLNTGNAWYELTRDMLHWLLEEDGTRRNHNSPKSESSKWPHSSGFIQKRDWLLQGFHFQHVERELGQPCNAPLLNSMDPKYTSYLASVHNYGKRLHSFRNWRLS